MGSLLFAVTALIFAWLRVSDITFVTEETDFMTLMIRKLLFYSEAMVKKDKKECKFFLFSPVTVNTKNDYPVERFEE